MLCNKSGTTLTMYIHHAICPHTRTTGINCLYIISYVAFSCTFYMQYVTQNVFKCQELFVLFISQCFLMFEWEGIPYKRKPILLQCSILFFEKNEKIVENFVGRVFVYFFDKKWLNWHIVYQHLYFGIYRFNSVPKQEG